MNARIGERGNGIGVQDRRRATFSLEPSVEAQTYLALDTHRLISRREAQSRPNAHVRSSVIPSPPLHLRASVEASCQYCSCGWRVSIGARAGPLRQATFARADTLRKLLSHLPFCRTVYLGPAELHALSNRALKPASICWRIIVRSNSANAPVIWKTSFPIGVVVSMFCWSR